MNFIHLFEFCGIVSLFCFGLYITTEEGMLLHFLKKPYDRNYEKLELAKQRKLAGFSSPLGEIKRRTILDAILTPIIGCIICFGSFWTLVWYTLFYGFSMPHILVLSMFIVSGLNALIIALYSKL